MGSESFKRIICGQPLINDRYSALKPLSDKGYFSYIFKGRDESTGEDVAIKFFNPDHNHDIYRLRCFDREARILTELKGMKNVIEIIEGPADHKITFTEPMSGMEHVVIYKYIAMELAISDIEEYIYEVRDTALDILTTFKELCKAVFRLHTKGICHRDLKPDNFLVCECGSVKVSDFGTAIVLNGDDPIRPSYTRPVGHTGYAAPELFFQIGIRDEDTYRADIYSLGAILFEMITKSELFVKVYSPDFRNDLSLLSSHLLHVDQSHRKMVFDETIETITTSHRLPDIWQYNDIVPSCIRYQLNDLYQSMCDLNYKKRNIDYMSIHRQLDICILLLRNQKKEEERRRYKKMIREKIAC